MTPKKASSAGGRKKLRGGTVCIPELAAVYAAAGVAGCYCCVCASYMLCGRINNVNVVELMMTGEGQPAQNFTTTFNAQDGTVTIQNVVGDTAEALAPQSITIDESQVKNLLTQLAPQLMPSLEAHGFTNTALTFKFTGVKDKQVELSIDKWSPVKIGLAVPGMPGGSSPPPILILDRAEQPQTPVGAPSTHHAKITIDDKTYKNIKQIWSGSKDVCLAPSVPTMARGGGSSAKRSSPGGKQTPAQRKKK